MFTKCTNDQYKTLLPGIQMRTLVYGEKSLMSEFHLTGGSQLPCHQHPYEQTGYLVSGHIRLLVGEEIYDVEPGDSWCIAMNLPHAAEILIDSVAVEVFSPVRVDYLPEG